jgi:hypothetical protein
VKTVVKHVEKSILESSDRTPNTQNNKNGVYCFWQSCPARHLSPWRELHRTATLFLCFPLRESTIFNPKFPILIPLTPNLSQKFIYTFIKIKRHSNPYKTWIKTSFYHKSSINLFFIKLLKTTQIHTITL